MSDGHWQLEGNAAELYQRYLVPAITAKWAQDLVDRALLGAGEEVLDVACGTGVVARLAAAKVAPGYVTGLDLNAGMLTVARGISNEGAPISWKEGSALDLPLPVKPLRRNSLSTRVAILSGSAESFARDATRAARTWAGRAQRLQSG